MNIFDIPHCGLTLPTGTMISTNLYLHYHRMLLYKLRLFFFLRGIFLKILFNSLCSNVKLHPSVWRHLYPKDHDLNRRDSVNRKIKSSRIIYIKCYKNLILWLWWHLKCYQEYKFFLYHILCISIKNNPSTY